MDNEYGELTPEEIHGNHLSTEELQRRFDQFVTLEQVDPSGFRFFLENQNHPNLRLPPRNAGWTRAALNAFRVYWALSPFRRRESMKGSGAVLQTTTDHDLKRIAKSLGIKGLRIVSANQLLKSEPTPGSRIINLDDSSGPGTHWVALYSGPKQEYTIYFDPFGADADLRTIAFMRRLGKQPIGLTGISQDPKATSCGYWCLYFLDQMNKGTKPEEFMSTIDVSDQAGNEKMLRNYFM